MKITCVEKLVKLIKEKNLNSNRGYSLVEVIAAVAILGIVTVTITQALVASANYFEQGREISNQTSNISNMMEEDGITPKENKLSFQVGGKPYEVAGQYYYETEQEEDPDAESKLTVETLKAFQFPELDGGELGATEITGYLEFNGTSYINLTKKADNAAFSQNDLAPNGYTVATRIRIDRAEGDNRLHMGVYGMHSGGYGARAAESTYGILMQFYTTTKKVENYARVDFSPYNSDTEWVDWVQTYDPVTRTQAVYANGVKVAFDVDLAANSRQTFEPYTAYLFRIGHSFYSGSRHLIGDMSAFRVWDVPLSAEEVANIDLTLKEPSVSKDNIYVNIDISDSADIVKYGTFVGSGHAFK